MSGPRRSTVLGLWAAPALLAALVLWRAWPDVVDDAWISFRAARSAALGAGLTFNPEDARPIESFSNPLLTLLAVPACALGLSPILVARALGLAGLAACVLGAFRSVRLAGGSELGAHVAGAATLGSFSLVFFAWTGLETTFYAGLVAGAAWRWLERGEKLDPLGAILFFLVGISRPEAPLVLCAFAPVVLTRDRTPRALGLATAVALALGAMLALRFSYYGALVPNTFHAKSAGSGDHDPTTSPVVASLAHVGSFALALGLVLPLASLAAPLGPRERARALAAPALALLVFALYAGGDWMPGARYLAPAVPLVAALGALGLDRLAARGVSRRPTLALGLALAAALLGSADLLVTSTMSRDRFPWHVLASTEHLAAARDMRERLPAHARIVTFRIGALGWAGDFEVIDLLGLADPEIAAVAEATPSYHPQRTRMGDDVPAIAAIVRARDPDAMLLVTDLDARCDETLELWGLSWTFVRAYPLGADQSWALYARAR